MPVLKIDNFEMLEPCNPSPAKKSQKERNMEQKIWKEFPEELFEAVAARLPITDVFRFRSVCKKWNSLLTSQTFPQKHAQIPRHGLWFYTINDKRERVGAMYDPSLQKWHHSTIPALPNELALVPVASAWGLVCFFDISSRGFCVCNPLTRSFKKLPAMSINVWTRFVVGMTLSGKRTSEGYKILFLRFDTEYEVYDSITSSWTRPGGMLSTVKMPMSLDLTTKSVSIDGTIYFPCSRPDGIASYDTETRVWKQFVIPAPPHLRDHALAECGGQLMLVGLQTEDTDLHLCVWELQMMSLAWYEVDRMPDTWWLEFPGEHVRNLKMTCFGNVDLLMLSLRSGDINQMVTYDIRSQEWLKVPGYIVPFVEKRQWKHEWIPIPCGTSFHPCLAASA